MGEESLPAVAPDLEDVGAPLPQVTTGLSDLQQQPSVQIDARLEALESRGLEDQRRSDGSWSIMT